MVHKSYGRGVRKGTGMPGKLIVSRASQMAKFREEMRKGKEVVVITQPLNGITSVVEVPTDNSTVTFDQKKMAEIASKSEQPKYEIRTIDPNGKDVKVRRYSRRDAEAEVNSIKGKLTEGWKIFLGWFDGKKNVVKEIERKDQ
jgi:hypothetical protein